MSALPPSPDEVNGEISSLVGTLLAAERRLTELTGGEVDAVTDGAGRTFLLRRAQEQMRQIDAGKQAAILNALPAHIALLDAQGAIVSVNEAWRELPGEHVLQGLVCGPGFNYLEFCGAALGEGAPDAWALAAGIRTILAGTTSSFAIEYACRSEAGSGWFLMTVTPLSSGPHRGAVVMHLDISERRRAELERKRFFTVSVDLLCIGGFDGYFKRVNPAFMALLGVTETELYARPLTEFIHADDHAATNAELVRLASGATTLNFENRYRCHDGTYRWISWTAVPYSEDKTFYAAGHDITARKQAEESLQLLRSAVEQSKESIIITDADLELPGPRILFVNPAFTQMTGYSAAEAVGRTPRMLQGPRTDPVVIQRLRQYLSRGEMFAGQTVNYRKDGRAFQLEWQIAPIRNALGTITHFVAIQRDVTKRKQDEESLRLSEERFRQVVENIREVFWIIDVALNSVTYVSPSFTEIWGQTPDKLYQSRHYFEETVHPADLVRYRKAVAEKQVAGNFDETFRIVRPDGTLRWIHSKAFPVRNALGKVYRIVGIAEDITERKGLEEQSLRAQRLESLGLLAAGISHDLNNVLAPISMAVSLLRERLTSPQDLNMLDILEKSGDRGAGLVRQILSFAHGTSGEARIVQVRHLLNDVGAIVAQTFPKSVTLESQVSNDLWLIMANPTQIHQVLLNLCVNARDAMPHGGILRLNATNCLLDPIAAQAIEGASSGAWVMLEVGDNGTGIAADILARIWEPFFTTKPAGQGTGLGLSTVRGIVETYRGFTTLQTEVGRGTTIRAYLPATAAPAAHGVSASPFATRRGEGELILLADDELAVREIARTLLTEAGYRVIAAADGAEALREFEVHRTEIALVVTDLDMPLVDGETLARSVLAACPAMKIIATSGISSRYTKARPCGFAAAFISKPFTAYVLLSQVQQLLYGNPLAVPPAAPAD